MTNMKIFLDSLPITNKLSYAPLVTMLSPIPYDERDSWPRLSLENLARAYGEDEPDYSLEDIAP